MSTTLSEVEKVWSGDLGVEIAEIIDQIGEHPAQGIKELLTNREIMADFYRKITSLDAERKKNVPTVFRAILNKDFIEILPRLEIDGVSLKRAILADVSPRSIVLAIKTAVEAPLETRSTNSSIVYLTGDNVRRTELIEHLNITSYNSILENFTDFNVLKKKSASDSIVFSAVLPTVRATLFFKVYPIGRFLLESENEHDEGQYFTYKTTGLDFEKYAYEQLYKLVKYHVTPNIICKTVTANLTDFDRFIRKPLLESQRAEIQRQVATYNKRVGLPLDLMWSRTGMIMTQAGGDNFGDEIRILTPEERKHVMFQLMYTFYVFEHIEFSHGDLHTGNIFIIDVPETPLCFVVEGQVFRFRTTKIVKIYDFDHGTLCKDTSIRVNTTESVLIPKRLNPNRNPDGWMNKQLGETNIFNKNLDIIILCTFLTYYFGDMYRGFVMFGAEDPDFDQFFGGCFPGFDRDQPISDDTIRETYEALLEDGDNLAEANRIFGIEIANSSEIHKYKISDQILNMTWLQYAKRIKTSSYGRIVKDFENNVANNNLWIPDEVITPRRELFAGIYFRSLLSAAPIDIRREIVYTIDNR